MWHTKNAFFREMQFWSHCYTVVSYQALFRLSVYKFPAVHLLGAKNVCFCTKRDFGSPTNNIYQPENIKRDSGESSNILSGCIKIVSIITGSAYIGLHTRALPILAHVILKGGNSSKLAYQAKNLLVKGR